MSDERRQHLAAVEVVVKEFHYEPYDMAEVIIKLRDELDQADKAYGTCDMENAVLYETRDKLYDENAKLRAAIDRVRALHKPYISGHCIECSIWRPDDECFVAVSHPCPTLRALDGEA